MKIRYLGHSCFEYTTNQGEIIITDPFTKVGYELPKGLTADIVTLSHAHFDHAYLEGVEDYTHVLRSVGKHIVRGITVEGIETWHDPCNGALRGKNIVFKLMIDGMVCCHLGDLGEACSMEIIEKIGKVDVLFLPIGGTYTIDYEQAFEYIEKLSPKIAIPMHYKPKDGVLDIQDETLFLRLYQENEIVRINGEIELTQEDFPAEGTKIIFMERTDRR